MQTFKDKVAIITGAASGIGWGLAERCGQEGMKVVLADVEESALAKAEADLKATGAEVLAVLTDVSKAKDVENLAEKTLARFGSVHLLCNNAGVALGGPIWKNTLADWEWVMGVNLWGVIHGMHTFVPLMLKQVDAGHIVNTASIAGLSSLPGLGVYNVTKHGVVALSETLYRDLAQQAAKIKVSVLCPGAVNTQIMDADRNRPDDLQNKQVKIPPDPDDEAQNQDLRQELQAGMSPQQVADYVFQAIREERFYILTHPNWKAEIQERMEDILQDRDPIDVPMFNK